MHGQFHRHTKDIADLATSNEWLSTGNLKRETEALLMAAQEQSLRTNSVKNHIDKTASTDRCRMCKAAQETSEHLVSGCSKLAQKEYKRRHDAVGRLVHWRISKDNNIEVCEKWYQHEPADVVETDKVKILWNFNIQTDNVIEARRPDIVVVNKDEKSARIIGIAIPIDRNVKAKQEEKITKYQDLAIEIKRIWRLKAIEVIPVVIGALGTVAKDQSKYLKKLQLDQKYTYHYWYHLYRL